MSRDVGRERGGGGDKHEDPPAMAPHVNPERPLGLLQGPTESDRVRSERDFEGSPAIAAAGGAGAGMNRRAIARATKGLTSEDATGR